MKTIEEIRRENLLILIGELGTIQAIADRIGKSHSQVSQWKNASMNQKTQKPRAMDSDSARLLEMKCHKEIGWMDNSHGMTNSVNESKNNHVTDSLQEHDELRRQLLYFYNGMSQERREAIVMTANGLYSMDNPDDRTAMPFGLNAWEGQENRKGVKYGEIDSSGVRKNVSKDNRVSKPSDHPGSRRLAPQGKKKTA
jgi:hypothetical protein